MQDQSVYISHEMQICCIFETTKQATIYHTLTLNSFTMIQNNVSNSYVGVVLNETFCNIGLKPFLIESRNEFHSKQT